MLADGQTIVFLGDSITEAQGGYVDVVQGMIGAIAPQYRIKYINSGIGGNKVDDMLARIDGDVIAHDPDLITVSVGINDVWQGVNGTPLPLFKERYEELITKLEQMTVAKLVLFTTTVIMEDLDSEGNRRLAEYNDFIRQTAKKHKALMVPMNEEFHKAISAWQKVGDGQRFTTDGVHMNLTGNCLMALTLLKAWKMV